MIRVDEDCIVHSSIGDVLQKMVGDGLVFWSSPTNADDPAVIVGMNEFVQDFANKHNIVKRRNEVDVWVYPNVFAMDG